MGTVAKDRRQSRRRAGAALLDRLQSENARLRAELHAVKRQADTVPVLPAPDADGFYPAEETLRVIVAQQILSRRRKAGWSQAELAQRARVRQETVSRLESGRHAPTVTTVDKLDRALKKAGV